MLGLKYMCLCKVMLGDAGDVASILSNKIALSTQSCLCASPSPLSFSCASDVLRSIRSHSLSPIHGRALADYAGQHAAAMQAIADAATKRSLHDFEATVEEYKMELSDDPIIARHLKHLYASILEQVSLCRCWAGGVVL